jgi:hypothetical protein
LISKLEELDRIDLETFGASMWRVLNLVREEREQVAHEARLGIDSMRACPSRYGSVDVDMASHVARRPSTCHADAVE